MPPADGTAAAAATTTAPAPAPAPASAPAPTSAPAAGATGVGPTPTGTPPGSPAAPQPSYVSPSDVDSWIDSRFGVQKSFDPAPFQKDTGFDAVGYHNAVRQHEAANQFRSGLSQVLRSPLSIAGVTLPPMTSQAEANRFFNFVNTTLQRGIQPRDLMTLFHAEALVRMAAESGGKGTEAALRAAQPPTGTEQVQQVQQPGSVVVPPKEAPKTTDGRVPSSRDLFSSMFSQEAQVMGKDPSQAADILFGVPKAP